MLVSLYILFHILVRIFIFSKVLFLLFMTSSYPELYPISTLTWWIYFLIFDIWLEVVLPTSKKYKNNDENNFFKNNESL
jgi:hypothetical protein